MNQTTRATNMAHNRPIPSDKFEHQVSYFSALVGQPHWQNGPMTYPNEATIARYQREGRQLRFRAIRHAVQRTWRPAQNWFSGLIRQTRAQQLERKAIQELQALDQHLRNDLGISREDIQELAEGRARTVNLSHAHSAAQPPAKLIERNEQIIKPVKGRFCANDPYPLKKRA